MSTLANFFNSCLKSPAKCFRCDIHVLILTQKLNKNGTKTKGERENSPTRATNKIHNLFHDRELFI